MTYCVGMQLDRGLVFLSDSRTNAGVDQISTFRKMTVFEHPGERLIVLLSAGNLAVTQSVRQIVCENVGPHIDTVWNAKTMFEAVRVVGEAVREVHRRDGQALKDAGIEFNCSFIFGGQIRGDGSAQQQQGEGRHGDAPVQNRLSSRKARCSLRRLNSQPFPVRRKRSS